MKPFNYNNLGYWFLLLIACVFAGFYTTYFSRIFEPTANIIHIHFVLMALWIVMLIVQPFLIKFKKIYWHRILGKVSYLLVPLLLMTTWLVTRNEYYRKIENLQNEVIDGVQSLSQMAILKAASVNPAAFIGVIWFVIFYSLAINFRRKPNKHARYMLATALILLSPTIDRFIAINLGIKSVAGIASYFISFLIIDIIIAYLLLIDYKNKRETKTLKTCLFIFIIGQLSFYILPNFDWWAHLMEFAMMPKP
jgi:hypothetical protein